MNRGWAERGAYGFIAILETHDFLGMTNGGTDVWIIASPAERRGRGFHRKNIGMNHVAFRVDNGQAVDTFQHEFLAARRIAPLYGGPPSIPRVCARLRRGFLRGS